MGKILFTQNFDLAKALNTEAGKQLIDPLTYMANAFNNVLRIMLNGLTFADNFACELKTVTLRSGVVTTVSTVQKKRATKIEVSRLVNDTYYSWSSWGWKYNPQGELVVKLGIADSPPADLDVQVDLIIYYG